MNNNEKQRKIGKQLLLLDIIFYEADRIRENGFSFVNKNRLAAWASMEDDEIDSLIETCSALNPRWMAADVADSSAYEGRHEEENAYAFLLFLYRNYGPTWVRHLNLDSIDEYCDERAESYYIGYNQADIGYPVSEKYGSSEMLKSVILDYIMHFYCKVIDAVSRGFDWDVINKMLRSDISRERFDELEKYCMKSLTKRSLLFLTF